MMGFRFRLCFLLGATYVMGSASLHAQVNVTTFHNDNARTGQNVQETLLGKR